MENRQKDYIAHVSKDGGTQSVEDHLNGVGEIASRLAAKIGVSSAGNLIGLLHDLGKFSGEFQAYIGSATGRSN